MTASPSHPAFTLSTHGPENTEALARELAAVLPAATVVGLSGPLGAGKTCFVRGLADGLGIDPGIVCSPSFVYQVRYDGGRTMLVHADLYRLGEGEGTGSAAEGPRERALESIGLFEAIESRAITVVEWWEHYAGPEPQRLVNVEFSVDSVEDRTIRLNLAGEGLEACREILRARVRPPSR